MEQLIFLILFAIVGSIVQFLTKRAENRREEIQESYPDVFAPQKKVVKKKRPPVIPTQTYSSVPNSRELGGMEKIEQMDREREAHLAAFTGEDSSVEIKKEKRKRFIRTKHDLAKAILLSEALSKPRAFDI
ncbi:MAG: hypothetical protein HRT89_17610 [Lentisphaeria bacterium]|nr:hypothetical protein [Lentisphaeria bacterium]NQZ69876.1 hypothetical protein [Lentisphaeria bacterium]